MESTQEIKPYDNGNYHIEAKPYKTDSWRNAKEIEVLVSLIVGDEKRIFKGILTNTGIIKI
jgi:hypothetical protein